MTACFNLCSLSHAIPVFLAELSWIFRLLITYLSNQPIIVALSMTNWWDMSTKRQDSCLKVPSAWLNTVAASYSHKCHSHHSLMNNRVATCLADHQISPLYNDNRHEECRVTRVFEYFALGVRLPTHTHTHCVHIHIHVYTRVHAKTVINQFASTGKTWDQCLVVVEHRYNNKHCDHHHQYHCMELWVLDQLPWDLSKQDLHNSTHAGAVYHEYYSSSTGQGR